MARGRRKPMTTNDALVDWIRSIMSTRGWTASELARRSKLAPSTLLRALNNDNHPFVFSLATLEKISGGAAEPMPRELADRVRKRTTPGSPHARRIEIRNVSAFPTALQTSPKSTKPELVAVPPQLQDDKTVFAFRNPDDSLGSWFRPRSLMFATKARDPIGGDLVMLTGKDGRTRVRLLLEINESGLSLSKTMPAKKDEEFQFDEIGDVAVIVVVIID
jgi:hypothetical protein